MHRNSSRPGVFVGTGGTDPPPPPPLGCGTAIQVVALLNAMTGCEEVQVCDKLTAVVPVALTKRCYRSIRFAMHLGVLWYRPVFRKYVLRFTVRILVILNKKFL